MSKVRLRNTDTGKFFSNGSYDSIFVDAEILDTESADYIIARCIDSNPSIEEVPVIDDSKKPVKVYQRKGDRDYLYKGYRIAIRQRPCKVKGYHTTYLHTTINGTIVSALGIREATKMIDDEVAGIRKIY
jgi:hypothetical protein